MLEESDVVPIPSVRASVDLLDEHLHIRELDVSGVIVEAARAVTGSATLEALVVRALDIGGAVLVHGQSQATVEAIAAEIDRLVGQTASMTEQLPTAMQERLNQHLTKLAGVLAERFDSDRTTSVQNQIATMVKGATAEQVRTMTNELLGETGPINAMHEKVVSELKLVNSSSQDVLAKVVSLVEKVEGRLALDDARERSTQKGLPFQEVVQAELDLIHGPLGDKVRCTATEYGGLPNCQAGDFVVTLNPQETGGREVHLVVEAKTGKLSGPRAQAELEESITNRQAAAGILVFDGPADAPLGGRHYCPYPGGRFIAVLDADDPNPLALEVACRHARSIAIATADGETGVGSKWLSEQCDKLSDLIEKARRIKHGANEARRGLTKVDEGYDDLRDEAMSVLDQIKARLSTREEAA